MEDLRETDADRMRMVFDLFDLAEKMMRQNLRRAHPLADDAEIERQFEEWLHRRPGAEHGDAIGRPRPLRGRE